ncbi:hypothetical protein ABZ805_23450 [Saccharopolyspora sp. NPDC047091]|uniref:TetR family transcriptional regulator C-terminal domain-containing protein n=1 Tax=Saccharopolyspora sp. NPDC047091 TaxID=3155924 RepID=UPI0034002547
MQTGPGHPGGCLVVLSATAGAAGHERARSFAAERRAEVRRDVAACIGRAVDAGELPADRAPAEPAAVFAGFMWGISTEARDGVPLRTVDAAVGHVLRIWDSLSTAGAAGSAGAGDAS